MIKSFQSWLIQATPAHTSTQPAQGPSVQGNGVGAAGPQPSGGSNIPAPGVPATSSDDLPGSCLHLAKEPVPSQTNTR